MKKIQWFALASLSAVVAAGASRSASTSGAKPSGAKPTGAGSLAERAAQQAPVAPAAKRAEADGFRPSEFAGVSVRERPSRSSTAETSARAASRAALGKAGSRGWIALKPGAPRGGGEPRVGAAGAFTAWRKGKGTTRLGGDKLTGTNLMHVEVATRDARGRLVRDCVPAIQSRAARKTASR